MSSKIWAVSGCRGFAFFLNCERGSWASGGQKNTFRSYCDVKDVHVNAGVDCVTTITALGQITREKYVISTLGTSVTYYVVNNVPCMYLASSNERKINKYNNFMTSFQVLSRFCFSRVLCVRGHVPRSWHLSAYVASSFQDPHATQATNPSQLQAYNNDKANWMRFIFLELIYQP